MFITFEGIEGSGKSTQIQKLDAILKSRKIDCISTREPGGTDIGRDLRSILLKTTSRMSPLAELYLYAADRAEHIEKVILPAINSGKTVFCDRFIDSTFVYQGFGRKIDLDLIKKLYSLKPFDIKPDLTFLLDLSPQTGLNRILKDVQTGKRTKNELRFENEKIEFHKTIRNGYLCLAKSEHERIKIIDANKDIEDVTIQILKHLEVNLKTGNLK